ncbi:mechanosensitive ion channel family protein [bacterium]|nr:mechanosensitive ion channel family protein [bacterium]MBU1984338.1 mechanosensitive ion channel family protein [bacterium]
MFTDFFIQLTLRHVLVAGGVLVGSLIVGFILDRVVLAALKRAAERTSWEGDDLLIKVLRGVAVYWLVIAGLYVAVHTLPLSTVQLHTAKRLIVVIFLISATFVGARIVAGLVDLYTRKDEATSRSASILTNVVRGTVIIIGGLIILQYLGISITPILTALGVAGLAVALALQGPLSNLFSGMQIIASRKVNTGDYIRLESGEEGYVTDINWDNTTMRQLSNNIILVPNSKLANAIVIDYNQPDKEMSVLLQVGVSYRSDLEHVEHVTIEVAKEVMQNVPGGVPTFEPFIRYHTFGDFAIGFTVILRVSEFVNQYPIKHEFIKRLHARYRKENIEIPFPIRTLEFQQLPKFETESQPKT